MQSALLDVGTVQDSLDGYVDAEAVRVANESIRIDNETGRVTAEGLRVSAETLRQEGYATMDEAIALKADSSEIETARGTELTLGARLDASDTQLNDIDEKLGNLEAGVASNLSEIETARGTEATLGGEAG